MDKKQNAIKLLGSESSNTSDSKDSINLDDISDEPVLFDISPNVNKGAPKEAVSLDLIMRKEKTIKLKRKNVQ